MNPNKYSTTNLKASQLNYDHYTAARYDREIINAIPSYKGLHNSIIAFLSERYDRNRAYDILDLGVGTGLTCALIKKQLPYSRFDVVDFSQNMLASAKRRLGGTNTNYILGDYSELQFSKRYDIIASVIGIHHQTNWGKRKLFKKIHSSLKEEGIFVLGDLMTYRDKHAAALNEALHFHHLVEHSADKNTITEWAYHHKFLNLLAPMEDQIEWLRDAGFCKVKTTFRRYNTVLILARKNRTG